jgi:hypothetical protein
MQQLSRGSYHARAAPSLLPMLIEWKNSETHSLTVLSFHCVVLPPFFGQIPMVSATHWPTPTPGFSAQRQTCPVCIWIVFTSATSHISNPKFSHFTFGSQQWSMIEWWITSALFPKEVSVLFIISSRLMWYSCRGEKDVSTVLEIVGKMGK